MERYHAFDEVRDDMSSAIEAIAQRHGIDTAHPIAMMAVLEAIASPLKLHKLNGTPLTRAVGMAGSDAYEASLLARRVEEIKSPASLVVNPMMDSIAAALSGGAQLSRSSLLVEACRVFMEDDSSEPLVGVTAMANDPRTQAAFGSALGYLSETEIVVERLNEGGSLFELAGDFKLG